MSNLTKDQIKFEEQTIILGNRVIPISSATKFMIEEAIKEDVYQSVQGEMPRTYDMISSEYVLKGVRKKKQTGGQLIHQRIIRVSEYFSFKYLNATNISYSGQIHYAEELLEGGIDINIVLDIIMKRFDITDNSSSVHSLKRRIVENLPHLF